MHLAIQKFTIMKRDVKGMNDGSIIVFLSVFYIYHFLFLHLIRHHHLSVLSKKIFCGKKREGVKEQKNR